MIRCFGRSVPFGLFLLLVALFGSTSATLAGDYPPLTPVPAGPGCAGCPGGPGVGAPYMPRVDGGTTGGTTGTTDATGGASNIPGFVATGGAGSGSETGVGPGYIDDAIPATRFRLRYDSMYNDNRPDRAEFIYPKCSCFRTPDARGLGPKVESGIDFRELSAYFEYAASDRFSGFIEAPIRFIEPQQNNDHRGLGDINFGFKYALVRDECSGTTVTFQLRNYVQTGDSNFGLGTDHYSFEPALLLSSHPRDRVYLFGEIRDWIPVNAPSDYAGNVLRAGVGAGYAVYETCGLRVVPIAELVGWYVFSGKETDFFTGTPRSASGDTIVNAKFGVRVGFGEPNRPGLFSGSDFYVGYGRALTGEVWYKDIVRVEYRMSF
jgi:hypothetical protein